MGPHFFCDVPTFLPGRGSVGSSFEISRMNADDIISTKSVSLKDSSFINGGYS